MLIPLYRAGEIVYIIMEDEIKSVIILQTSLILEDEEIYYKVQDISDEKKFWIVNEMDIRRGVDTVPTPAYSIGDNISFNFPTWPNGATSQVVWDVYSGLIEEILIKFTAEGYTVGYKTDEHKEGDYVLEDDVVSIDLDEEDFQEEQHVVQA